MGSQIAKIGSIIVHTVDYNGVGVLGGHRRIPRKIDPSSSHPRPGSLRVYQIRFRFQIFLFFCTISRDYYKRYTTTKYITHQR